MSEALLFLFTMLLCLSWLKKPLSEDEGNWYYLAVFWSRGVRPFKGYDNYGFFGIPLIAALTYNLLKFRSLSFFKYFKTVWYAATTVSVYWLAMSLWQEEGIALSAGIIFALIVANPSTYFVLTYGEHFFLLPINLGILFYQKGVMTGDLPCFLISGLMAGWAVQIKPTAMLFAMAFPIVFVFNQNPFLSLAFYFGGFVTLNVLPAFIIKAYGGNPTTYFKRTFGPVLELINLYLEKLQLSSLLKRNRKLRTVLYTGEYIFEHHSREVKEKRKDMKILIWPMLKETYPVCILATVQLPMLFMGKDFYLIEITGLLFIFLLMQQLQKNFFPPHFNPMWVPVSILAGKTCSEIFPAITAGQTAGWFILMVIGAGLVNMGYKIALEFTRGKRDHLGACGDTQAAFYRLAETIGRHIRENSKEGERLLVWGDYPAIYLYAQREAFHQDFFFLYANHDRLTEEGRLLESLRAQPPHWVLFFKNKVNDEWNMETLQGRIGVKYNHIITFRLQDLDGNTIQDPRGIHYEFPLYRRDEELFAFLSIERALNHMRRGETGMALDLLKRTAEEHSDNLEAKIRHLALAGDMALGGKAENERSYGTHPMEGFCNESDPRLGAVLWRLRAEGERECGRHGEAVACYKRAVADNPEDYMAYNGLGELLFLMGDEAASFEMLKKALEINPFSPCVLNNIGVLLAGRGEHDLSIAYFQKALSIMEDHTDALANLQEVRELAGGQKGAKQDGGALESGNGEKIGLGQEALS